MIIDILKEIANTSKSGEKKAILAKHSGNSVLKEVFEYTYNPEKVYGVKNAETVEMNRNQYDFEHGWPFFKYTLDAMAEKQLTGNAARDAIEHDLEMTDSATQKWMIQILNKDLKIGLGLSEALKVWPGLVPVFDVVLAKAYKDHKEKVNFDSGEWVVLQKIDGCRIISQNKASGSSFKTREGKYFTTMGIMAERFAKLSGIEFTIDGELCSIDEKGNEDFKSIIKVARRKDYTIPNPTIKAFDFLSNEDFDYGTSKKKYTERMEDLNEFIKKHKIEGVLPIEYERITSKEVFDRWLAKARKNKWEGLMLRKDVPYKNGRISELLKVKDFQDAEYVVEGIETGKLSFSEKGKGIVEHECVSALKIKHKGYDVKVGSGLEKEQRIEWFKDPGKIIGKKITVSYFEETTNDSGGVSLRFPTLVAVRDYE
ncbi:MAG: hypothetical protein LBQ76_08565 [Candidatus Fibromonas sp.]|jgi:DNA ligase-1|nr:hypothetical protein [Candidatus Fibromonas sp.]